MSLVRDISTVGGATALSRLAGFARDVGIASLFGAGVLSDAYFAALQVPNLFRRLLAEGALNASFVPIWLKLHDEDGTDAAQRFAGNVLGVLALGLCLVALAVALFAPAIVDVLEPGFGAADERRALTITFMRWSAPYIGLAAMAAVAASLLNARGRVTAAAFGPVVFNGVLLTTVMAVVLLGQPASRRTGIVLSAAVAAAGLGQVILLGVAVARSAAPPRAISARLTPQLRAFLRRAGPGVVAGGIPQLKLMAGLLVASQSAAAVSWLYYANRLYELPLGVVAIAIASVFVPRIAAAVQSGERSRIALAQSHGLAVVLGLTLPAATAFIILAVPIAAALFQRGAFSAHDSAMVAMALTAIAAGLPGHSLEKLFGAISFAHQDTRTPMLAALVGLAVALIGAFAAFPHYGHAGIAAAIGFSGWIGAIILGVVLWRRGWIAFTARSLMRLPRIALATFFMAVAVAGLATLLRAPLTPQGAAPVPLLVLTLIVLTGLAVYVGALHRLRVMRIGAIMDGLRRPD